MAAGLEFGVDVEVPQKDILTFVGSTLQLEQRNKAMNSFIEGLTSKLHQQDIDALIVKGQGIAQCYEKPLWRSCGDVDLLLSADDYAKAKNYLTQYASSVEEEDMKRLHLGLNIDSWLVELHGTLHTRQLPRVNIVLGEVQRAVFNERKVRMWMNGRTQVFLPAPDEDVVFVFSHIIQHFFGGGIGLRQVCDWCRLLFCYREKLDLQLLELRMQRAGLMSEWKVFAAMAVNWLGMPMEAMPLFSENDNQNDNIKRKGDRVLAFIMETGNFGHNRRDGEAKGWRRNVQSLSRYTEDLFHHITIFPLDSMRVWGRMVMRGAFQR